MSVYFPQSNILKIDKKSLIQMDMLILFILMSVQSMFPLLKIMKVKLEEKKGKYKIYYMIHSNI